MSEQQTEQEFWKLKKGKATQDHPIDGGKSLIQEVELLREQVTALCAAVRGLVTLIAVLDKKVDTALKGGIGADFAVM
jgi:hypothetical protein